jgi:ADP-ribosyl-[dinitrogen reductase] hydrolase
MRCAPTGLVRRTDDTRLVTEAIELSAITHADPRCTGSCVAMCAALARLVEGADVEGALQEAGRLARPVCLDVADLVEGVLSRGAPRYQREPIGYVLLSLERALIALRDATDLEPALVEVVNMGGDSDTNGCIAGALLGARCGADATPQRWLDGLQDCERFEAVARELAEFA